MPISLPREPAPPPVSQPENERVALARQGCGLQWLQDRISSLDALRGLLALTVFIGHAGALWLVAIDGSPAVVAILQQAARYAVVVFFVLSGFAIAMSLDDNIRRGFSISRYASARFIRVVPPLLAALLLVWFLGALVNAYGPNLGIEPFAARQQYQMALIPALGAVGHVPIGINSPLWSLQYEIQLYVIAGLGAWLLSTKSANHRLAAMVLLIAFLFGTNMAPPNRIHADARAPYFLAFAMGVVGYVGRSGRARTLVAIGLLGGVAITALSALSVSPAGAALGIPLWSLKVAAVAVLSTAFVVALSRHNVLAELRSLGAWSYTLYIVHYPLVLAVDGLATASGSPSAVWAMGAPCVLLIAYGMGRLFERPNEQRRWLQSLRAKIGATR